MIPNNFWIRKKIFKNYAGQKIIEKKGHVAILGDSLKIMPKIKSNTFKMIFADPPYNIGKIFGKTKEKWEKEEYIAWCKKWIDESMRVLRDDGVLCFMSATQFMPYLDCYVDERYKVVSRVIWYYDSSGVQSKTSFGSLYEPILIISKNKEKTTFNRKNAMVEAKTGAVRKLMDYRKTPPQRFNTTRIVGNVWEIPRVKFLMKEYETHPTQKPERLLERIISIFTNEKDLILDPFAGTFTSNAVAQRLGRYSVGIEQEEEYYKIGLRRLELAKRYKKETLFKSKKRVTKNKSKKDHQME